MTRARALVLLASVFFLIPVVDEAHAVGEKVDPRKLEAAQERIRKAEEALAKSPEDPGALLAVAAAYTDRGRAFYVGADVEAAQTARGIYARVLARDPKNPEALLGTARAQIEALDFAGAIANLEIARPIANAAGRTEASLASDVSERLSHAYLMTGHFEKAVLLAADALGLAPSKRTTVAAPPSSAENPAPKSGSERLDPMRAAFDLATSLNEKFKKLDAESRRQPKNPTPRVGLAELYLTEPLPRNPEMVARAIALYRAAIDLDTKNPDPILALAQLLLSRKDDPDGAIDVAKRILKFELRGPKFKEANRLIREAAKRAAEKRTKGRKR